MKKPVHQSIVALTLLILIPASLYSLLALAAVVSQIIESGLRVEDVFFAALFLLPLCLLWWGSKLLFRLRLVFSARLRKELFGYYGLIALVGGIGLFMKSRQDGGTLVAVFSPVQQVIAGIFLLTPVALLLFMRPDSQEAI